MVELSDKIKICSALMKKTFYINNLDELFNDTNKHIIDGTFKNITKSKQKEKDIIILKKSKEKRINREAFIQSILNCINYFEDIPATMSEELYSINSSYFDNEIGKLNEPVERCFSEKLVNYVKIFHNNKEVFWLSTYLNESSEYEEKKNMNVYISYSDLFTMHTFDILRETFVYFPLMENSLINFVIENNKAATEQDITNILSKHIKIFKIDKDIKEVYKSVILKRNLII